MKKYVHVINNIYIIEYPIYEDEMANRFPDFKFPIEDNFEENVTNNGFACPKNHYEVIDGLMPLLESEKTYKRVDIKPFCVNLFVWQESFIMVEQNENAALTEDSIKRNELIHKRNLMLQFSDRYVVIDRWNTLNVEQQQLLKVYRQALRDIDFRSPVLADNIVFPEIPDVLDLAQYPFNY